MSGPRRNWGASTLRRTVLLVSVVGAVVLGLLAMHTLQTGMGNHNAPMSTTGPMSSMGAIADAVHPGDETMLGTDQLGRASHQHATVSECSGMCDPEHAMAGMICILALLLTGLLLAAIRPASSYFTASVTPLSQQLAQAAAARPGPAPPDLNLLSISRT